MLLRQVQARPLQGHHLRALRRRGDPPEGAPRAHGPHRPGRSRLAHLVLQGRPEPHRLPARHRPARAREGPVLRCLDRHLGGRRGAAEGPERPRGQGQGRVRADLRRPRRGSVRARGQAEAPPQLLHQGRGAQLRRGRRLLVARPLELGRGAGPADARGGTRARRRHVPGGRPADHDGRLEEDPRARPQLGDPRRPPPLAEGARDGRDRGDPDPRGAGAAQQAARQGDRLEEGRAHEAHQPRARGTALQEGQALGRGRGARDGRRREAAREGPRPRQGAPEGRPRAGRPGREPRRTARADERPLPAHGRQDRQGGPRRDRPVAREGARDVPGHGVAQGGRQGSCSRLGPPARGDVDALPRARAEADRQRRADLPRAQGPLRLAVRVRRLLPGRHGRRVHPRAAQGPRPQGRGEVAARDDQDLEGPEAAARDQAAEGRERVHHLGEPARVDGSRGDPGDPARAAPDGAAGRRPLRHQRPERSLPARDQPEQPAQAPARPRRTRDHRQQREADAAGGRRRALRQRAPRPRGHGPGQPRAEVALRHAQGQAGPVPPEPARQARRLLGPLGDRRRAEPEAAPVRPAQADGARALQAVHHEPARRAQVGPEHQGGQEARRLDGPGGLGRARGSDRGAPGAAEQGADAPPARHPGLRAGAGRGQGDPGSPARLPRLQRRLRRRPDGRPPAAVVRGAGRGAHPDALLEQHPLPGERPAAGDADAGHGPRRLLHDVHRGRPRRDEPRRARSASEALRLGGRGRAGGRGRPPGRDAAGDRVPQPRRAHPDDARPRDPERRGRALAAGVGSRGPRASFRSSTGRSRRRRWTASSRIWRSATGRT